MGIDSICSNLLKTVGLLSVRLHLTKLRLKNHEELSILKMKNKYQKIATKFRNIFKMKP